MKASEFRERTLEELEQTVVNLKQDIFNLRFQHATGQLDDTSRLSQTKRDLARVNTVLREHQLGLQKLAIAPVDELQKEG